MSKQMVTGLKFIETKPKVAEVTSSLTKIMYTAVENINFREIF